MAQREKDPGPIPNRWLKCPRKATGLFSDKFLAFKTPLGPKFNAKVPEADRFTPAMLFTYMHQMKVKVGLWIDLTNTSRFYDKEEIENTGCKYVKMQCRGHGETPSLEQTREFIHIVTKFKNETADVIGVHCTHGFNRTGFLLVSYMVDQLDCSVELIVLLVDDGFPFLVQRPPGIYKQDYIQELYKRYDDIEFTPAAPARPDWCLDPTKPKKKKGRRETTHKKAAFMPGVRGVEPFDAQPRLSEVQLKAQQYCGWKSTGFPGSQPVSMDTHNVSKLTEKPYRVSWKADGVRYMMLIDGEGEVYMLDRDNCVFHVIRLKQFWDLPMARQLLGDKFAKTLSHEPDGLIFQPSKDPYVAGRCDEVLKWKPSHMNSVDFRLKIVTEGGQGILPKKIGQLFVGQLDIPFSTMRITKAIKGLDNKIIECKFENGQWTYMRERTDKSYPNSYNTAKAVCDSIKDPVTTDILLDLIDRLRFHDDSDIMPPPKK
ncbi:mRNA-capping enzyme, partial [Operophtera brumata]